MYKWTITFSMVGILAIVGAHEVEGATLCVNPRGTSGCNSTISGAVATAAAGDAIRVAEGIYAEDVVIGKSLSLIGAGSDNTIIDASGKDNGIDVDGYNNPGLNHVVVSGFTVRNANRQGILVVNASYVTVTDNRVTGSDKSLVLGNPPTCPGIPTYFKPGEDFDCGEAIHLSGVHHSSVTGNIVRNNAGGILLSDDTGPTHHNLVSENVVQNNPFDCGITIASHHFAPAGDPAWIGVSNNTISRNYSSSNGLSTGEGAGVGLFTGPPGARTMGNVVSFNILVGNALPGVTMHSHTINQNLNDNMIVGNYIADNGGDSDVTAPGASPVPAGIVIFSDTAHGAPPVNGTVILENTIKREGIDIQVVTDGAVDAHLNNLFDAIGVSSEGAATANGPASVDATENWWKCAKGSGSSGCGSAYAGGGAGPLLTTPWLTDPWQSR
jgi:parallel beta-helix repeat protein